MTATQAQRRRLLVVDDNEFIRKLFVRMLPADRFEMLTASGPTEALRIAEVEAEPVDLLVTDVVLPEMKGPELFHELERLWPGLRVLYMSGYPQAHVARHGVEADHPFLEKPFNPASLTLAVAGALPDQE